MVLKISILTKKNQYRNIQKESTFIKKSLLLNDKIKMHNNPPTNIGYFCRRVKKNCSTLPVTLAVAKFGPILSQIVLFKKFLLNNDNLLKYMLKGAQTSHPSISDW